MTDILKTYGNYEVKITKNYPMSTSEAWFTVEELAAAIEARIIAKLDADWWKQFGGENVPDTIGN